MTFATGCYVEWIGGLLGRTIPSVPLGPKEAFAWLRECAKRIAAKRHAIQSTPPIGMPVAQCPERRRRVKTLTRTLYIQERSEDAKINKRDQVNGLAPNSVHSLDASHTMRTALACREKGIAFAAVHDCFWTHASDMDRLGRILREEFVALHERPALEVLYEELQATYPGVELPSPPATGRFDPSQVLQSTYFFC